jgi:hypothetical protein
MKKIFLLSLTISVACLSCSPTEEKNYKEFEGVWKRIGIVKYENQVAIDTFFFPEGRVIPKAQAPEVSVPGGRYKIFGDGHSIWFYSHDRKVSRPDAWAKTTYTMRNDSLFEDFTNGFWHDAMSNHPRMPDLLKDGFKAKIDINGDFYSQYRLRADGSASYGELYEKIDTYNVNPTKLTGAYNRVATVQIRNGKKSDTIDWKVTTGNNIGAFQIIGDSKRLWAFNFENLDSLGNDTYPGSSILSSYKIDGDLISDHLIFGTKGIRDNWERYDNKRERNFELDGGKFGILTLNEDKNGQIAIFEKQ